MSEAAASLAPGAGSPAGELGRPPRTGFLDYLLALVLGAMMLLPLLEIVLRKTVHAGISNQTSIVQHLTLMTGMLGAAIAAREGRLLSLGSLDMFMPARLKPFARLLAAAVAMTVATLLMVAGLQFAQSERLGGDTVAYGLPTWIVQLILPVGFALIAFHAWRRGSASRRGRVSLAAVALVLVLLVLARPIAPGSLVVPAIVLLLVAVILGAPIFALLGGAGLILFWGQGSPLASLTVDHYGLVTNPTLPALPLFTLAGYFLAEGGASRRLIRLFKAAVGQLRGGPAILVALVCAFFTAFTGASGVTILALGGLLMPVLISAGYSEKNSLGLLTGAGSLGLLLPPCLPLILYAVVANVDIRDMFLGGLVPGFLMIALTAAWGMLAAPRGTAAAQAPFAARELGRALWDAKWEVLIPVVALGSMLAGLATPVEAAALTAFYAFLVETVIHRDLHLLRDVPRVVADSGVLIGGVLLILGVALGFTNYLAFAEIPARAVEWVTASVHSKWLFLLYLNLFLLLVGMLMDIYSAIVIVVPLIVPLGVAFGINPVHLGIIFLANLELGYLTPPVGQNLFLSSLRFERPMSYVFRAVVPMIVVFLIGVLLITYLPFMTTWLPGVGR